MARHRYLVLIALLTTASIYAQDVTFKLKSLKDQVRFSPERAFLVPGIPNYVKMTPPAGLWPIDTVYTFGEISSGAGYIVLTPNDQKDSKLFIRFRDDRAGEEHVLEREYNHLPRPVLYMNATAADSAITREDLILRGDFNVWPKEYGLELLSARVEVTGGNAGSSFCYGCSLRENAELRRAYMQQKSGDVLTVSEIILTNSNRDSIPWPQAQFFVVDSERKEFEEQWVIRR